MSEPRRITERYHLEKRISAKESSLVYRATDNLTGEAVAVKLFNSEDAEAQREAFQAAARTIQELRHPALPRILDYGLTTAGSAFLVTEDLHGSSLESLSGAPAGRSLELLLLAVDGLEALHAAGLSHGNLRLDNLLLIDRPGGDQIKILGLGSALLRPDGPGGFPADLQDFAELLAAVLHVTARKEDGRFLVDLPLETVGGLKAPAALGSFLEDALLGDPAGRFPTWESVRSTLRRALAGEPRKGAAKAKTAEETRPGIGTVRVSMAELRQKRDASDPGAGGVGAAGEVGAGEGATRILRLEDLAAAAPPAQAPTAPQAQAPPQTPPPEKAPPPARKRPLSGTVRIPMSELLTDAETATATAAGPESPLEDTVPRHPGTVPFPVPPARPRKATDTQELHAVRPGTPAPPELLAPPELPILPAPPEQPTQLLRAAAPPSPPPPEPAPLPPPLAFPGPPAAPAATAPPMPPMAPMPPIAPTLLSTPRPAPPPPPPPAAQIPMPPAAAPPPIAAPAMASAGTPVVAPAPARRQAQGKPPWILIAAGGALGLFVVLAVGGFLLWRFRESPKPPPPPPVVVQKPTPAPVATPTPVAPPPLNPQIPLAEGFVIAGDLASAKTAIEAIPPELELSEEERARVNAVVDALAPLQTGQSVDALAKALNAGDPKALKAAIDAIGPDQVATLTPVAKRNLAKAKKILDLDARLTRTEKEGSPLDIVRQASALVAEQPRNSRANQSREGAAATIEGEADAKAQQGQLDAALAQLEPLQSAWPNRRGLAERIDHLRDERKADQEMEEVLASVTRLEKANKAQEGLKLLAGTRPTPKYAERFRELRSRLENQAVQADQRPPNVVLGATAAALTFDKGQMLTIPLRVTDDLAVQSVEGWVRPEGGRYAQVPVRQLSGSEYEMEVSPDQHQNKSVDIYFVATDGSGHKGQLADAAHPIRIKRKGLFSKIFGKKEGGG